MYSLWVHVVLQHLFECPTQEIRKLGFDLSELEDLDKAIFVQLIDVLVESLQILGVHSRDTILGYFLKLIWSQEGLITTKDHQQIGEVRWHEFKNMGNLFLVDFPFELDPLRFKAFLPRGVL